MKRFFARILFLCSVFFPLLSPVSAQSFSDIRSGSSLDQEVKYLSERGIIDGYPDGSFQPERSINRAEALKILFETVGMKAAQDSASGFPDVPPEAWFAKYVTAAKKAGVIRGYPDGRYRPEQEVNRAEFISMTMDALPFSQALRPSSSVLSVFSDLRDAEAWYVPAVARALSLDFLPSMKTLRPGEPMKRQEAVEMIFSVAHYLEDHAAQISAGADVSFIPEEAFVNLDEKPSSVLPSEQVLIIPQEEGVEIHSFLNDYDLLVTGEENMTAFTFSGAPQELALFRESNNCRVMVETSAYPPDTSASKIRDRLSQESESEGEDGDYFASRLLKNEWKSLHSTGGFEVFAHLIKRSYRREQGEQEIFEKEKTYLFGSLAYHEVSISGETDPHRCRDFRDHILSGFSQR